MTDQWPEWSYQRLMAAEQHADHLKRSHGIATNKVYQLPVPRPGGTTYDIEGRQGEVQLKVCTECPYMTIQCLHARADVTDEGKHVCRLCGQQN